MPRGIPNHQTRVWHDPAAAACFSPISATLPLALATWSESSSLRDYQHVGAGYIQVFAGTRLSELLKIDKSFKRRNVLNFIEKTAKTVEYPELIQQYDELCDVVHPSFGSNEIFWAEAGVNEEKKQVRVLVSRTAAGQPGEGSQPMYASGQPTLNRHSWSRMLVSTHNCVDTLRIPLIADTHSRLIADSVPGDRGHPGWGA
jgi:hypothetical protein